MRMMMVLLALVLSAMGMVRADTRPVVIITGQEYHDWRKTAPELSRLLGADTRLHVSVQEDPSFLASPKLHDYSAVVLNYMNWKCPDAGPEARANLKKYVENGGGLVIFHFAIGAFQDWDGFRDLIGRTWDPNLRGHDPLGTFQVDITQTSHPITQGMKAFPTTDELYTCMAGDQPIEVLATAISKVDHKNYPMAWVRKVGKGRIFACMLGHDVKTLSNPEVRQLYARGTAWAAGLEPASAPLTSAWPLFPFCINPPPGVLQELGYAGFGHLWLDGVEQRARELSAEKLRLFQVYVNVDLSKPESVDEKRLARVLPLLKPHRTQLALLFRGAKSSDHSLDDRAAALINRLADLARANHATIVLYPHAGFWVETTSDAVRLAAKINRPGQVGVMFNLCHWMRADPNRDLHAVLTQAKPWLMAVTLNGSDAPQQVRKAKGNWVQGGIRPLGQGTYDVTELLKVLKAINYQGPVGLQCYGIKGDPKKILTDSKAAWDKF